MIIVTGCDNTGKSGAVKFVSQTFNIPVAKRFPIPPKSGDAWRDWVIEQLEQKEEMVYDRFFIDELVYGPIKRNGYICSMRDMATMSSMLLLKNPIYIYTEIPVRDITANWGTREQYINSDDVRAIVSRFHIVNQSWPINQLKRIDFSYLKDPDYIQLFQDLLTERGSRK